MNPTPLPNVIHLPCRKCGGERHHLGTGVCWDCMTPAERERFRHGDVPAPTWESATPWPSWARDRFIIGGAS